MKKGMLKNKRIDDAQLEKVSGGVSVSLDDQYKEFSKAWERFIPQFMSNKNYQSVYEAYLFKWSEAGFKPDAYTFLTNNFEEIDNYIGRRFK